MTLQKYNRLVFGDRTSKESYSPSGRWFDYLTKYINDFSNQSIIIFNTSAEKDGYLTDPNRVPGILATDRSDLSNIYILNADGNTWLKHSTTGTTNVLNMSANSGEMLYNLNGVVKGLNTFYLDNGNLKINCPIGYLTERAINLDTELVHKGYVTTAINNAITSVLTLKSNWNATTNVPELTNTVSTGDVYIVNVAGETDLGGITTWEVGDWVIKGDGEDVWLRIPAQTVVANFATIEGDPADNVYLQSYFNSFSTKTYIEAVIEDAQDNGSYSKNMIIDFNEFQDVIAIGEGFVPINVTESMTVTYENFSKFTSLWMSVNVSTETIELYFSSAHISGDSRWVYDEDLDEKYLTLPVGIYTISVVFDGTYYHVTCSEKEV